MARRRADRLRPLGEAELRDLYNYAQPGSEGWFAERITKKAIAARLIAHGHSSIARGNSAAFDPDDDVAAAQAEMDGVVRATSDSETTLVADLLEESSSGPSPPHRSKTASLPASSTSTPSCAAAGPRTVRRHRRPACHG